VVQRVTDAVFMKSKHRDDRGVGESAADAAPSVALEIGAQTARDDATEVAPAAPWRSTVASRVLAAALFGLAEALDPRQREQQPLVEEAPRPTDDDWLVLLDREEPGRSLVIIPHRIVAAARAEAEADRHG
jgi:hypothetical protein